MGCSSLSKTRKGKANIHVFTVCPTRFIRENNSTVQDIYSIESLIGEGTYGKVYLAVHKLTQQKRAIKIVNKRSIKDTKVRFKFVNEISILKVIDHPNIIKLYEFFEDSRNYYLITDYLAGGELLDYVIRNKVLSEQCTAHYLKQLLESVSYLHSKNIVHRDIKLENLVFESSERDSILKLIDFGTSVIRNPLKRMKHRKGTISYLAPEVIKQTYNEKCDLWSVGVIMYVLLSGKMPFGGRNEEEILECISKGNYKIQGEEWLHISDQAIDLLKKLLHSDPSARISASEALGHEWFSSNPEKRLSEGEISEILFNLQNFRANFKLQRAVMCFIANNLINSAEKAELTQVFRSLDSSNCGKISESDLYIACTRVWGERISRDEIKGIIEAIDIDRNGFIDYTEFIMATLNKEKLLSAERLETAFKVFNKDGSGRITASELKEILDSHDIEDSSWEKIVEEVDQNGDGGVDLKEFKDMMLACL